MTYPNNIEKKIDFDIIRQYLLEHCQSIFGKEQVEKMQWQNDYKAIVPLIEQTNEMLHILQDASLSFPRGEIYDMREVMAKIRLEGSYLTEEECFQLRKTLQITHDLALFIRSLNSEIFPQMHTLLLENSLDFIAPILKQIDKILDKYGNIADNASAELARIRREMQQAKNSVERTLISILKQAITDGFVDKETTPTLREGRLVLPIPPAYKRKINGIVHDESATGKTVFVEPQQVVEINNRLRELQSEEQREKIRILTALTNTLRPNRQDILNTNLFLGTIDFLYAKAQLAIQLNAIAPIIQREPIIDWRNARHPILFMNYQQSGKIVVPLNIRLGTSQQNNTRILVISGPNAGGKSVCLKTVALLQYMLQCGLLVPLHESSTMGIFENLLIDIGDEQSINDDLSTYSSHLKNMRQFLKIANNKSLILIDEFGSGTEPSIGGAIAEVVLKKLNEQNTFGVITTHYTNLKHFAQITPKVVNGAMLYDKSVMKPLFQLSIGVAGSSYAIEIAKQIGLSNEIIEQVTQLVGSDHINYDQYLNDIARDKHYWENKRQQIKEQEKRLEEKEKFYEKEISELRKKQKEIIKEANEQATKILQESNATIERAIREIKETKAHKETTQKARQKVEKLKEQINNEIVQETAPNDKKASKKAVFKDFRDLKALSANPNKEEKSSLRVSSTLSSSTILASAINLSPSLDIRGMRADEATNEIMNYVDEAIMVGMDTVTILHGTGTGALKQIVRDYLREKNKIMYKRSQGSMLFHDGDPNTGGAGLTIIEFKYNK